MARNQQKPLQQRRPPSQGSRDGGGRSFAARPSGPTSIAGVESSDLPDKGRGSIETDPGHELGRNVPQHTGEVVGSDLNTDVGATGKPESRQADQERHLGRHGGDK